MLGIGEQIAEGAVAHLGMDWTAARHRARELLERVRLPEPDKLLAAFPHQLSGGQRQRVAIAAAIAAGPRLLIADEATSALDTIVQAEIVSLLASLVAEEGMTLLFITHDIALASGLADRIAVFRQARLVEIGSARDTVSRPSQAYTAALIAAHLDLADAAFDRRGRRPMSAPLLLAEGLSKSFSRAGTRLAAVEGVSFSVGAGETLGIVGPSGSGKTTLARLIMRLIDADAGSLQFDGA